ncbi:hypothetical protein EDI_163730, partial [Entamoeba dispar SAW760]
ISTSLDLSFSSAHGACLLASQLIKNSRPIQVIDNSSRITTGSLNEKKFVLRMDTGDTTISSTYYFPNHLVEQRYTVKSEEDKTITKKRQEEMLIQALQKYNVVGDGNENIHLKIFKVEREDVIKPDEEKGLSCTMFKEYYEKNNGLVNDLCQRKAKLLTRLYKKKKNMEPSHVQEICSTISSIQLEEKDKLDEIENELNLK